MSYTYFRNGILDEFFRKNESGIVEMFRFDLEKWVRLTDHGYAAYCLNDDMEMMTEAKSKEEIERILKDEELTSEELDQEIEKQYDEYMKAMKENFKKNEQL